MKKLVLIALAAIAFTGQAVAQDVLPRDNGIFRYYEAPRWRESESHPLRTVAYIGHPIGWVLREAIYRPFSYLASSTEFTRSFFGYREPNDIREPLCFFDSDKVPDCRTLAPYNSIGKECTGDGCGEKMNAINEVVFPDVAFDFDKSDLNELGKAKARDVSKLLASMPEVKVSIEGYTDNRGSEEYNMKLGQRRADSVAKELTELGIDKSRMTTVSYGESKPLYTEDADWAYAANRRVEFKVVGSAPMAAAQ